MKRLSAELRSLNPEIQPLRIADAAVLYEFRESLDAVRLTAWTAHELIHVEQQKRDPGAFLNLLAAERLRRCAQMMGDISGDVDARLLPQDANLVNTFYGLLESLRLTLGARLNRKTT